MSIVSKKSETSSSVQRETGIQQDTDVIDKEVGKTEISPNDSGYFSEVSEMNAIYEESKSVDWEQSDNEL